MRRIRHGNLPGHGKDTSPTVGSHFSPQSLSALKGMSPPSSPCFLTLMAVDMLAVPNPSSLHSLAQSTLDSHPHRRQHPAQLHVHEVCEMATAVIARH